MLLSSVGALLAFSLAIYLIIKKVPPVYSMMLGAFVGGIVVCIANPELVTNGVISGSVTLMVEGSKNIITSVLRILAAGILAGFLIKSRSAESIANFITDKLGAKNALLALALSTMILTSVGVFVDIAVITVAPIALSLAKKVNISRLAILVAMIGGGKCGNILSPNPNTLAVTSAFDVTLESVVTYSLFAALMGLLVTVLISKKISNKGSMVSDEEIILKDNDTPHVIKAIVAPITVIILLSFRPLFGLSIDPMIALPLGGIIGVLVLGHSSRLVEYANYGLTKMSGVAIMLIGTGALAGVISASELGNLITSLIEHFAIPGFLLAPISGSLMSFATASTTSGATVASDVFGATITGFGVSSVAAAAMVNASATVLDHMPHGSFFHSTSASVNMKFDEALKMIGYATVIGLTLTLSTIATYLVVG